MPRGRLRRARSLFFSTTTRGSSYFSFLGVLVHSPKDGSGVGGKYGYWLEVDSTTTLAMGFTESYSKNMGRRENKELKRQAAGGGRVGWDGMGCTYWGGGLFRDGLSTNIWAARFCVPLGGGIHNAEDCPTSTLDYARASPVTNDP